MIRNLVIIFVMHFVAGYFLQTKKISTLKREKKRYLFLHVGYYTSFFIVFSPFLLDLTFSEGLVFSLFNGVMHLIIDYFTGQLKKKYHRNDDLKYKFTVGIDYTLHLSILMVSYVAYLNYISVH